MCPARPAASQTPQVRAALDATRAIVEADGQAGLTMRGLGARIGISGPSLYEHFPNKAAVERALVAEVLWEGGDRMQAAAAASDDPLVGLCDEYRTWALAHPHLYRLAWCGALDRDDPAIVAAEEHAAAPLIAATGGDRVYSRCVFVFVHGLIVLELERRLPADVDLDELYRHGLAALRAAHEPGR